MVSDNDAGRSIASVVSELEGKAILGTDSANFGHVVNYSELARAKYPCLCYIPKDGLTKESWDKESSTHILDMKRTLKSSPIHTKESVELYMEQEDKPYETIMPKSLPQADNHVNGH